MNDLAGKRITVVGLGRFGGGIAVTRWLVEQQAHVLVTDQAEPDALKESCKQLEGLKIDFRLGEHREEDFTSADLVVSSPAVPLTSKYLSAARAKGIPITTEIRLFIERCPATIFGVTGTKGKSTTTAMLGQILSRRFKTWVGGNIGVSLLGELPNIKSDHLVVLELSSFMLEHLAEARWSPHVALVTMLAADHLDRHGTFEAYLDAKKTLLRFQGPEDYIVVNEESGHRDRLLSGSAAKVILFGVKDRKPFELKIPGEHNQLNAQGAFAAASIMGISWQEAQDALLDFRGLPHRLQLVHEAGGVRYYNDSIATIPEAAIAALCSFPPRTVIQVVGGYDKHLSLVGMCAALVENAKAALCIGDTGPTIARAMGQSSQTGAAAVYDCHDLETAMKIARQIASPGDVVLLSTGCASYDQFDNFEQRGQRFAELAKS